MAARKPHKPRQPLPCEREGCGNPTRWKNLLLGRNLVQACSPECETAVRVARNWPPPRNGQRCQGCDRGVRCGDCWWGTEDEQRKRERVEALAQELDDSTQPVRGMPPRFSPEATRWIVSQLLDLLAEGQEVPHPDAVAADTARALRSCFPDRADTMLAVLLGGRSKAAA